LSSIQPLLVLDGRTRRKLSDFQGHGRSYKASSVYFLRDLRVVSYLHFNTGGENRMLLLLIILILLFASGGGYYGYGRWGYGGGAGVGLGTILILILILT